MATKAFEEASQLSKLNRGLYLSESTSFEEGLQSTDGLTLLSTELLWTPKTVVHLAGQCLLSSQTALGGALGRHLEGILRLGYLQVRGQLLQLQLLLDAYLPEFLGREWGD